MRCSVTHFFIVSIIISQTFCSYDIAAQTLGIEVGEQNINLDLNSVDVRESDSVIRVNGQILYSKQNNHQDLFASVALTGFMDVSDGISAGAGIRVIAADPLDYYLTAVAVGIELVYQPDSLSKFNFNTGLYYAGELLTFYDGDSVSWVNINGDYEIMTDTSIRLGYRTIKTEQTSGVSVDFDRGVYLGILRSF